MKCCPILVLVFVRVHYRQLIDRSPEDATFTVIPPIDLPLGHAEVGLGSTCSQKALLLLIGSPTTKKNARSHKTRNKNVEQKTISEKKERQ